MSNHLDYRIKHLIKQRQKQNRYTKLFLQTLFYVFMIISICALIAPLLALIIPYE